MKKKLTKRDWAIIAISIPVFIALLVAGWLQYKEIFTLPGSGMVVELGWPLIVCQQVFVLYPEKRKRWSAVLRIMQCVAVALGVVYTAALFLQVPGRAQGLALLACGAVLLLNLVRVHSPESSKFDDSSSPPPTTQ